MLKNFTSGSSRPVSSSMIAAAVGPCSSKRYCFGGPEVRTIEFSSRSSSTSRRSLTAWNSTQSSTIGWPTRSKLPSGRWNRIASPMMRPSGLTATYCLALPGVKVAKLLTARRCSSPSGVWPAEEQVGHVMGLVEQRAALPPGGLLAAPVAELRPHREGVRARLRVAQELDCATGALDRCLQAVFAHLALFSSNASCFG